MLFMKIQFKSKIRIFHKFFCVFFFYKLFFITYKKNMIGCNYENLALDEACLFLNTNDEDYNATLYSLSSDCVSCPFKKVFWIEQGKNSSITLKTDVAVTWRVYNDTGIENFRSTNDESGIICQFQPNVGQYGIYELTIDDEGCEFDTIVESTNPYIPLAIIFSIVLFILFGFSLVRIFVNFVRKKRQKEISNEDNNAEEPSKRRMNSIDTFMGIIIALTIFVNNGGGYTIFQHSTWDGLLIGDFLFPSFLWIIGFCIPISLSSSFVKGVSRFSICRGILKRSVILFFIGVSLNTVATDINIEKIRIFGFFQRFAIAHMVVGISYALFNRTIELRKNENQRVSKFADFLSLLPQWIFILIIVIIHCGLTFFLPVPGCPTGYLGPGGRHEDGKYFNCTGGATGYIDIIVIGKNNLHSNEKIMNVYGSEFFDSEGILGCLTTIFQTFLGVQAGTIFKFYDDWKNHIFRLLAFGILCGCLGASLHFFDIIPINRNLWSLSFVFSTTSFALILFTLFYFFIDVTSIWRGEPFRILGINGLFILIAHNICYRVFPFNWKYGKMNTHVWQTIAAIWTTVAWTIVGFILHRFKIHIKI